MIMIVNMNRFAFLLFLLPLATAAAEALPRPPELEPAVRFWTRVYTEIDGRQGFLHDPVDLRVIYERIDLPEGVDARERARRIEAARERIQARLRDLAAGRGRDDPETRRIAALWGEAAGPDTFRAAAGRVRFQLGQADKFRAGLVRSGRWLPHVRAVLRRHGLPEELAALPHVESSYNPNAYSKVGAAGMWQFTRSTGRRYLRVDHVVDERLDPYRSTEAAAELLRHNYEVLGHWPLAITAYNHGLAGMRRAVAQVGSHDLAEIIDRYRGRGFGFASRNFYAAFLAAADIAAAPEKHFGPLTPEPPERLAAVELTHYVPIDALAQALDLAVERLRRHNPALREPVWRGDKHVPRGYVLRVPDRDVEAVEAALAALPESARFARQRPDRWHHVARGETLSEIAARYGLSVAELSALNGLRSAHRIRAGQRLRLRLPADEGRVTARSADEDGLYTVRAGDTLAAIAADLGLEVAALAALNGIDDPRRLRPGMRLRLAAGPADTAGDPTDDGAEAGVETEAAAEAAAEVRAEAIAAIDSDGGMSAGDDEAESDAPGAFPEAATASADPADYSVSPDGRIRVQAAETLGHYAEWLDLRAQDLRRLNGLRYGQPLIIGRSLRLDFSRVSAQTFTERRIAYHRALQAAFFAGHRIVGVETHRMRRGESIWVLTQRDWGLPLWLLMQYNPDLDLHRLRAGDRVRRPLVEVRSDGE